MESQLGDNEVDTIKSISFNIALFIIGAIFVFFGLSGGITLNAYNVIIQDTWARILLSVAGTILAILAIFFELKSKQNAEDSGTAKDVSEGKRPKTKFSAQGFFYTLDDKQAEGFPTLVKDAVCVQILARTIVNLLSQYEKVFEQIGREGCEIRLLFVDPSSEASKFLYGSNPEVYRNNTILAAQHLKKLKHIIGPRLQVRVIKPAPTVSLIMVDKKNVTENFMQVQFYFLHSAVGRDRPLFRVIYGDKWYRVFQEEFNQLWTDSVEWDITAFLNQGFAEGD